MEAVSRGDMVEDRAGNVWKIAAVDPDQDYVVLERMVEQKEAVDCRLTDIAVSSPRGSARYWPKAVDAGEIIPDQARYFDACPQCSALQWRHDDWLDELGKVRCASCELVVPRVHGLVGQG